MQHGSGQNTQLIRNKRKAQEKKTASGSIKLMQDPKNEYTYMACPTQA
jgi:hypothetical protein